MERRLVRLQLLTQCWAYSPASAFFTFCACEPTRQRCRWTAPHSAAVRLLQFAIFPSLLLAPELERVQQRNLEGRELHAQVTLRPAGRWAGMRQGLHGHPISAWGAGCRAAAEAPGLFLILMQHSHRPHLPQAMDTSRGSGEEEAASSAES